jgi:hypothetical protein
MTGMELFDHQVVFCQRAYAKKPHEHRIDPALGVISPDKQEQKNLLSVDYVLKVQGDIMEAVGNGVNLSKLHHQG